MKIQADVCIVGTGFCGYAAYKNLSGLGLKIIVVEGGDVSTPANSSAQEFYNLEQNKYVNQKLKLLNKLNLSFSDRKYTLGGSSECWAGYITPLSSKVYKQKFSEWPLEWGKMNLSKYDERSLKLMNSPLKVFNDSIIPDDIRKALPELPKGFKYGFWAFAPEPMRLKNFWIPMVAISPQQLSSSRPVICNYRLADFRFNKDFQNVKQFVFKSPNTQYISIESKFFVIACGGIENAYLARKIDKGIQKELYGEVKKPTNSSPAILVEHPHLYRYAYIKLASGASLPEALISRFDLSKAKIPGADEGSFKLFIVAGGENGIPGVSYEFIPLSPLTTIKKLIKWMKSLITGSGDKFDWPNYDYALNIRAEQIPSTSSAISFSQEKVEKVNWNVSQKDFKYYSEYTKRLLSWLKASSLVEEIHIAGGTANGIAYPSANVAGGAHHMTTYPYDKNNYFVDDNFRLVSSDNVYVVGSSLFPVTGWENPTVGAISTTLHATDHIKEQFMRSQSS